MKTLGIDRKTVRKVLKSSERKEVSETNINNKKPYSYKLDDYKQLMSRNTKNDPRQEADIFANQLKFVKPLLPYEIFMVNVEGDIFKDKAGKLFTIS